MNEQNDKDDSHHDALKKFVFEEEAALPPPPCSATDVVMSRSGSDELPKNRGGAFQWIADDGINDTDDASGSGGLSGFCAQSDVCGFSFL
jgi:hypothetical protein